MYLQCLFSISYLKSWPLNVGHLNNPVNCCCACILPTHLFLAHLFFTAVWTSIWPTARPRPPSPPVILRLPSWLTNGRARWRTSWMMRLSWMTPVQMLGPRRALTSSVMGRTPSMTVPHGSSWWAGWWWPLLRGNLTNEGWRERMSDRERRRELCGSVCSC